MPLTRLVLTQIIFTLAARMDFKDGRSSEAYKHRLLLLLDEFPSLGKMDLFERALGFIGGYGIKSYIIVQGLPQLFKAYGKDESIRVGCHIQVAFAPNDLETCEYLSKSTGQMTILKENYSESFQEGKLFGGKSRQTSLQEVEIPLQKDHLFGEKRPPFRKNKAALPETRPDNSRVGINANQTVCGT